MITRWRSAAIEIQISVRILKPRNGRSVSRVLIEQAIRYRAEQGMNPSGMMIRMIRWRHYRHANSWTKASDEDWKSFANVIALGAMAHADTSLRKS